MTKSVGIQFPEWRVREPMAGEFMTLADDPLNQIWMRSDELTDPKASGGDFSLPKLVQQP